MGSSSIESSGGRTESCAPCPYHHSSSLGNAFFPDELQQHMRISSDVGRALDNFPSRVSSLGRHHPELLQDGQVRYQEAEVVPG